MFYILYLIVFIIGLILAFKINYTSTKKQELVLEFNNSCWHFHHWMIFSILIFIMILSNKIHIKYIYMLGIFLSGFILEGLMFSDFYIIKESCGKAFAIHPLARVQYGGAFNNSYNIKIQDY